MDQDQLMRYNVIASDWYTPPSNIMGIAHGELIKLPDINVGVVAIASGPDSGSWKCYLGFGFGADEAADAQSIATKGVKVTKKVACAHFPELDPKGFKY